MNQTMKFARRRKPAMKSLVVKQSVVIYGHHSSVSIEGAFWNARSKKSQSLETASNGVGIVVAHDRTPAGSKLKLTGTLNQGRSIAIFALAGH